MIRVAIHGAAGRMGKRLVAVGQQDDGIEIVAALEAADHAAVGKDAGLVAGGDELGIGIGDHIPDTVQVVIDFAVPSAFDSILGVCTDRNLPLIVATTGLDDRQKKGIQESAKSIPIVVAPSMSMTVNLTMKLAQLASKVLGQQGKQVDVEIIERHHRFKEDAPSGTALRFGELISQEMGLSQSSHGREGQTGIRPENEIGYHAVRTGDNPGEHTIVFGLLGETLELRVAASNRDCYATGAYTAARFILGKSPGIYTMADVLGL